jgi:hypothetical protein
VPMNTMGDINFTKPKLKLDSEVMSAIAEKVQRAIG